MAEHPGDTSGAGHSPELEAARSLEQAMRTLRADVDRIAGLDPAAAADAAEQLLEDVGELDSSLAELADRVDGDHADPSS